MTSETLTRQWLEWDQDLETRAEILQLKDDDNDAELEKRLRNRIQFGTAGLRGKMQAGFAFMNSLTVIQTSQGLAEFLHDHDADRAATNGVVVGADARRNSEKYASLVVNALLAKGHKVWWLGGNVQTPLVSFATLQYGAAAGVMITASHNPAQDNGYKVYLQKGVQVNSPNDAKISQYIEHNLTPWEGAWEPLQTHIDGAEKKGFDNSSNQFQYRYLEKIDRSWRTQICNYAQSTVTGDLKPSPFVYTPLHGTGGLCLPKVVEEIGLGSHMISVDKQFKPDGNFPTVPFPNPEEDGALNLSMLCADEHGRDLIIANDPDADRFAVAQKIPGRKTWYTFTGNQIGVLLASHILENLPQPSKKKGYYMLNSTVSSSMLSKMCAEYGVSHRETLTGFKWMGNITNNLQGEGYEVPFAFEEALGYMFPDVCFDKDGITAAAVFLLAAAQWRKQRDVTPWDRLRELYQLYGHHETLNNYLRSPDPKTTAELFENIRAGKWAKGERFGRFRISRWRDMTLGYDSDTPDHKPELPVDKSSHMLTLWLNEDIKFTLRGSGTEPKVKFYIESWNHDQSKAIETVCDVLKAILSEWIKPFAPTMTYAKTMSTSSSEMLEL
ncbi:putative phosphoglucomutase [Talaromyces proteolyticus]|uniref:Phosphoglucomutase n=1 Tax=Talaromyces proteolyticus TaxID=1131652 RepID=A0AAD4KZ10_9EURO|nr:putative phosphoglucomutase [Talaromyces proteolyticus]KAH8703612.1 putative phosphoglucomutase [Talaromyces proteolyticus]